MAPPWDDSARMAVTLPGRVNRANIVPNRRGEIADSVRGPRGTGSDRTLAAIHPVPIRPTRPEGTRPAGPRAGRRSRPARRSGIEDARTESRPGPVGPDGDPD